jgi:ComF family protein
MSYQPAFEKAFVALRYEAEPQKIIYTFKYQRGFWLVHDLVYFLECVYLKEIVPQGIVIDLLVPVPTMGVKLRRRGYNQSELLVKFLAKRLHLPYETKLLCRKKTKILAQARLQRKERFQYAKGAYAIFKPKDLTGKTVLLVDDVMTTGATLNACATHLKQLGATVYTLVLARPLFG